MRGESRRRTGSLMARSISLVWDKNPDQADQRAKLPPSPDDASKLAEIMAELTYLDHLEAARASNVASLQRLKEACDALLESGLATLNATLLPNPPPEDEPVNQ